MSAPARIAAIALALVALAAPSRAETRHIAVVIGHNAGHDPHHPRRWAEDDAGKVADVLVQLGGVSPGALYVVKGQDSTRVKDAILAATGAVRAARQAAGDRVIVTFYYAGHSDGTAIELGGERLSLVELKALLAATGADVRVLIVDASGGGAAAPSVELDDQLATRGEATLVSIAPDEHALEPAELRGSIFTHHLVSGLRGAADASGDGHVTLSEAYAFARATTVAGATPTTSDAGDQLVLSDVGARGTMIELPAGFDLAMVIAAPHDQIVAEVPRDAARRIAVRPGRYGLRLWRQGTLVTGTLDVADGEVASARWDELRVTEGTPPPLGDTLEPADPIYAESVLGFGESARSYRTYLGMYNHEIDPDDFFHRVGRDDLADAYRSRRVVKTGLKWGGIAVIGTGVVYGLYKSCLESPAPGDPRFSSCITDNGAAIASIAGGSIVGGLIVIGSVMLGNKPAPSDEMHRMTDDYNAKLRERARSSASIAPYVAPGGGGAVLSGTF